jgi:hypothetical protein
LFARRVPPEGLAAWEEAAKRRRVLRAELRARHDAGFSSAIPEPQAFRRKAPASLSRTIHVDEFEKREKAMQAKEEDEEEKEVKAAAAAAVEMETAAAAEAAKASETAKAAPKMLNIRFQQQHQQPELKQAVQHVAKHEEELSFDHLMEDAFRDQAPQHQPAPPHPAAIPGLSIPVIPGVGPARPAAAQPAAQPAADPLAQLLSSPALVNQLLQDPPRLRALLEQYPSLAALLQERLRQVTPP